MTRLGRLFATAVLLMLCAEMIRGTHAFSSELGSFRPPRGPVLLPPDAEQLGMEAVSFRSTDHSLLRGWYIPSRTGAAVVLCHGTDGDRSMMLRDARPIAKGGAGVLMFDWPGHGESGGGPVRFGASERAALEGAVNFLVARPEVDPQRVGALGFSMGSYILAQVASRDTRLRAIVLEGAFGDADEQARAEYSHSGVAPVLGAILALRAGGMDVHELRPLDVIGRIAPRPVVLVVGTSDMTVPERLSQRLYDEARDPKELWVIDGARHGGYSAADSAYGLRLRAFFAQALTAPTAAVNRHAHASRSY